MTFDGLFNVLFGQYTKENEKLANPAPSAYVQKSAQKDATTIHNHLQNRISEANKIADIESKGNYEAINKVSGAYGKYQILDSTAKEYTKKLGIPHNEWKTPNNQERIFARMRHDYSSTLKANNLPETAFNIYGIHQQGRKGFVEIMNKQKLSASRIKNMRNNLPSKLINVPDEQVRDTWINYWKNKLGD